jgi:multidrug efflux pump subunit AcrA (membrane-fusion protein)
LLLLLVVVAIAVWVVHENAEKEAATKRARAAVKPSVTVTVASAVKGSIGVYLDAIGTVTPVYTSSITAQASGIITAVHYKEGQFVKKGDALIDIDPRPYQAQLKEHWSAMSIFSHRPKWTLTDIGRPGRGTESTSSFWMTRRRSYCRTRVR